MMKLKTLFARGVLASLLGWFLYEFYMGTHPHYMALVVMAVTAIAIAVAMVIIDWAVG